MSYTKTNWQDLPDTTTPITAARLNNMENGIENADILTSLMGFTVNGQVQTISNQNISDISESGFRYLIDCNVGGNTVSNGYILTLVYRPTYAVQFYIAATANSKLQFRHKDNGTWSSFVDV